MLKYWAYVLVGNNNTGKTTIQNHIFQKLCSYSPGQTLSNDSVFPLKKHSPCGPTSIFFSESSIQERPYPDNMIDKYYSDLVKTEDVCVISSHASEANYHDVERLITHLRRDCYNICGVFFENSWRSSARNIANLPWHEVLWIGNKRRNKSDAENDVITPQLHAIADRLADVIERRVLDPF